MKKSESDNRRVLLFSWIATAALSVITVAACALMFDHPFRLLSAPYLYGNDLPTFQYQGEIILRFFRSGGHLWGYSPYFMAGYPNAKITSGLVWGLVFIALQWAPVGARAAAFMLLTAGLVPIAYFMASGMAEGEPRWKTAGAVFGLITFLLGPAFFFWCLGLVEGGLSTLCVLLAYTCYLKWLKSGSFVHWAGFTVGAATAFFAHYMGGLCLAVLVVVSLPFLRPGWKRFLWLACGGILSIAANLFWLLPAIRVFKYARPVELGIWSSHNGGGIMADLFSFVGPAGSAPVIWLLLLAGVAGLLKWRRDDRRAEAGAYAAGLLLWTLISYAGEFIDFLAPMQPRRFLTYVIALMVVPGVTGVRAFWEWAGSGMKIAVSTALALAILLLPSAYTRMFHFKLLTDVPENLKRAAALIESELKPQTRVLVEDTAGWSRNSNPYQGGHFPAMLPLLVDRETLSGHMARYGLRHNEMLLRDGVLLNKPVGQISDAELGDFIELYNVGAVLCFSEEAVTRFDRAGRFVEEKRALGSLHWYSLNRAPGFIIGGRGKVESGVNRIKVSNLVTDGGEVVLKYHWDDYLKSEPPLSIERVEVGGDPVGFIGVRNPPASFIIYNGY